jgi:L-asparagine permease
MCWENCWNLVALFVIVPALIGGWYAVRPRVLTMARERVGYTGSYPVVAETPLMDELIDEDARQAANLRKEEGD